MNTPAVDWRRCESLEVARPQPYRKNDRAWVKQKNAAIVWRLAGKHLNWLCAAAARECAAIDVDFRDGALVTKGYHASNQPAARALRRLEVEEPNKPRARPMLTSVNQCCRSLRRTASRIVTSGTPQTRSP